MAFRHCLAKKNNSFCHPDRKHSQLESLKQRGSCICNLTSFFCAWHCGYNLDLLMSTLSSSLECQKIQAIPIRNIQSMTRLCNIAPICYTSCQKSSIPLQRMQSRPVTKRRKTYASPLPPTRVQRTKHYLVWMQICEWQSQPHPNTHSKFHTDLATSQESWKKIVIERGIIHLSLTPDELTANNEALSYVLSYPVQKAKRWTTEKNKTNKTKSLRAANKTQKKKRTKRFKVQTHCMQQPEPALCHSSS